MKISAILSDYDGTLAPITSIPINYSNNDKHDRIDNSEIHSTVPPDLKRILVDISKNKKIPFCIISSKDFGFLHSQIKFANVISCIMGIETIYLSHHESIFCRKYNCVKKSVLTTDVRILKKNSKILSLLDDDISFNYKDVHIDRKFTFNQSILAGITIDWRHMEDWAKYKMDIEPSMLERIYKIVNNSMSGLYVQNYSTHPFVDVYSVKCSKDIAYDKIIKQLDLQSGSHIMYLGDSENDNPVFRKADISIGICSDHRLNSKLDCKYMIDFIKLPKFLNNLISNDLVFNEALLAS